MMTRKPPRKTVIFFGADGTGKTTQVTLLLKEFRRRGLKARKAWIRARHSLSYIISQLLIKLGYRSTLTTQNNHKTKILDPRTLPAKWLWSLLEFVSVLPWIITRLYIPLLQGYYVVAERYVIDTIVYNQYFIGRSFNTYAKILLRMIPKDALLIHLDAYRQDVFKRRKGEILSENFIDYQLKQYRHIASQLNALSINTSDRCVEAVSKIISKAYESDVSRYRVDEPARTQRLLPHRSNGQILRKQRTTTTYT